jgi:ribonuclease P protein component
MSGGLNNIDNRVTLRRLRLPRTAILRGKKAFTGLFDTGKFLRGKDIDLKYTIRPSGSGLVHVAFIASKRLGNAVVRNRCKRLIREAYRLSQHHFTDRFKKTGFDLEAAFIAKRSDMDLQSLVKQMAFIGNRMKDFTPCEDTDAV